MVQLQYAPRFHEIVRNGDYKSRIKIYSIDINQNPIDVSNQVEVEYYATLLKMNASDEDSNARISQKGIKINDYFCKSENVEIGESVNCNIEISLINTDGYFSTYDWKQTIIIYWEVYDQVNSAWLTCPLGIYWWERPTKVNAIVVDAKANNAIYRLQERGNIRTFPPDTNHVWQTGVSLYDMYEMFVGGIPGILLDTSLENTMPNADVVYHKAPFNADNMDQRSIVSTIATAAGGLLRAKRDGYVTIKFFDDAYWQISNTKIYYTIEKGAGPTPIKSIDIGEYTVPRIDFVKVMNSERGISASAGVGTNTLFVVNCGALNVDQSTLNTMTGAIYKEVSSLDPYSPISLSCYGDPSVEAGDIIRVNIEGTEYKIPIFQQTLTWNGAEWNAEIQSVGYEQRPPLSEEVASAYESSEASAENKDRIENVELRTFNLENRYFDSGTIVAESVSANSNVSKNITFFTDFMVAPHVVASLADTLSDQVGKCSVSVTNITTTGCTIVLHNGDTVAHTLGVEWIALANMRRSNVVGYGVVGYMTVGSD